EEKKQLSRWADGLEHLPLDERPAEIVQIRAEMEASGPSRSQSAHVYGDILHARLLTFSGDISGAFEHYPSVVERIDAHPYLLNYLEFRNIYRNYLFNLAAIGIAQQDFDATTSGIDRLQQHLRRFKREPKNVVEIRDMVWYLQANLYKRKLAIEELEDLAETVENTLNEERGEYVFRIRIGLLYSLAETQFYLGNYANSYKWLQRILDLPAKTRMPTIIGFVRIIELIILLEQRDFVSMESAISRARYFFKKRNLLTEFEKRLFRFFNQVKSSSAQKETVSAIQQLREDLLLLFEDKKYWQKKNVFELIVWIDHKLTSRPVRDLLREEYRL
ncbi:MAG: hypothetical protein AAF570_24805, partial [Bacteroidota bacterium]